MTKCKHLLIMGTLAVSLTGCGIATHTNGISLSASPEGMRAFGDTLNGMITNGKASPDKATAHWNHRDLETKTPTWLDRMFTQETDNESSN